MEPHQEAASKQRLEMQNRKQPNRLHTLHAVDGTGEECSWQRVERVVKEMEQHETKARKTTERKETKEKEIGLRRYAEILTQHRREGRDQDNGQAGLL